MPNQPVRLYTQRFRLLDGNGEPYLLRTESTTSFVFRYREHGASEGDQFTEVFRFNIDNVRNYIWVELPVGTFDYYMVLNVAPLRTIQSELRTTTFTEGIEPIETFGVPIVPDSHQGYSPYINPLDHCWYQYSDLDQCFYNTNIKAIDTSGSDHPIVDYIEQGCMSAVTSNAVAGLKNGYDIQLNLLNQQVNNLSNKPNVTVTLNGEKHEQDPEGDIDLGELTVKAYNDTNTRMLNANETIDGEIVPKGSLVQNGYDNHDSVISRSSNHDFYHLPLTSASWWSLLSLNGGCQLNVKVTVYNNSYAGVVYVSRKGYSYEAVTTSKELANLLYINQGSSMYYRLVIKGQQYVAMSIDIEVVDGYPTWTGVEVPSLDIERNIPMAVFLTDIPETLDYVDIENSPYVTSFSGLETNNFRVHVADCQVQFEDEIDTLPQTFSFVAMQDNTVVSVTDSTGSFTAESSAMTEGQIGILTVTETERYWSYTVNRDLESVINKVTAITAYNRDSTTLYPSLKALTEYVDNSIDETAISSITVNNQIYYPSSGGFDLGNIAPTGYVSNITGYAVDSTSRSSLSLYNAYIREPRFYWYKDGNTALADRQGPITVANIITPMDTSSWDKIKTTLNCTFEEGKNRNDYSVPSLELLKYCVDHLDGQGGGSNGITMGSNFECAWLMLKDANNNSTTIRYNTGSNDQYLSLTDSFGNDAGTYYPITVDDDWATLTVNVGSTAHQIDKVQFDETSQVLTIGGQDYTIRGGGGGLDSVSLNGSAHTVSNNSVDLGTIKIQSGQDTFSANTSNLINIGEFSRPVNCRLRTNTAGWVKFSGNNSWFDVTVRNYEGTVRIVSYENNGGIRVLYTESGNRLNVYTTTYNSQDFYLYYGGNCNYYIKVNQGQIKITDADGVERTIHAYDEQTNQQYNAQMETGITESHLFLIRGYGDIMNYQKASYVTVTTEIDFCGTLSFTNDEDTTIRLENGPKLYVNDLKRQVILTNTNASAPIKYTFVDARNANNVVKIIEVQPSSNVRSYLEWMGGQTITNGRWKTEYNVSTTTPDYYNARVTGGAGYRLLSFAEDTEAIFECLGREVKMHSHNGELFLISESELQDTMWVYLSDSNELKNKCLIHFDYLMKIKVLTGSITVNEGYSNEATITPKSQLMNLTIDSYNTSNLNLWQLVGGYGDDNATLAQHKKYHRSGGSLSSINVYMSVPACTRQTIHIVETLYTTASPSSWTAFLFGKDANGNNYQISRQHSFDTAYGKDVSYPLKWDVKLQKWVFDEQ